MTHEDKITTELGLWWESFYETRDMIQELYTELYGGNILFFGPDDYGLLFPE